MLVYMAYDKKTGKIVHVHRAVDASGRSIPCSEEEVRRTLPAQVKADSTGVLAVDMEEIPSGRQAMFSVDVRGGTLVRSPVERESRHERR